MESASQLLNSQCRLHFCGRKQKTNYKLSLFASAPAAPSQSQRKKRAIIAMHQCALGQDWACERYEGSSPVGKAHNRPEGP